ncbi:MAG: glycosyltransferase [Bacteroides sp.]|nr:glycosyltransferase [Roseburia sp.]MCM1346151.1 glycosyltransferase [Bacteroides sp.]MCM1439891.1 glycosyltransferase [Roseburia sp.]
MKVVHLVHSLRGGGIQNFLINLASEQARLGNDVVIVVIDRYDSDYCSHLENVLIANNVQVICLERIVKDRISTIKTLLRCRRIIQNLHPALVNTHGEMCHVYGAYSTFNSKIKHFITIHNAPEKWNRLHQFCGRNKPLIFCSKIAYDMRLQESSNMVAIDNGISKELISCNAVSDLRKEYNLKPTDKIVVSVGSLRKQKNYSFLMDIVNCINDEHIHFFVCGGGNMFEGGINEHIISKYKNIHFCGLRSDISAIENAADLFLSCATFEGLPIAVLEAYFNGVPCVLSPIPQHIKIANIPKVWIPQKFEAQQFVDCIKEALLCMEDHEEIYKQRKISISQYGVTRTAKEYLSFYKKMLLA